MVLSACSPYFQSLFTNHPEKHPIVILKDVPFADMKSLLDFMYRGEVSVDQERLSAFLRVAESLRIKGLTEVNDDKPSNRDQSETPPSNTQNRVPPYVLQQQQQQRKVLQQQQQQQQQLSSQAQQQGSATNNPLLGSALSMPKRKRGRPRKLSGSDDVDDYDDDYRENLLQVKIRNPVKMAFYSLSSPSQIGNIGTIGGKNGRGERYKLWKWQSATNGWKWWGNNEIIGSITG